LTFSSNNFSVCDSYINIVYIAPQRESLNFMDLVSKPTGDRESDLEKGQHHVSPPSGAFLPSFSFLPASLEVLIVSNKDVGGSGAHEATVIRGQSEARSGSSQALPSSHNDANPERPEPQSVIDEGAICVSLTLVFIKE
jgi:hypothetical protein